MIFIPIHIISAVRVLQTAVKPALVLFLLLGPLLFAGMSAGTFQVAEQECCRTEARSPACGMVVSTLQGTAAECQKTLSHPWLEKDDLQDNRLRRAGDYDCLFNPETAQWLLPWVILPTAKSAPPRLKDIDLCSQLIRAGPSS